ncbi:DNA-3-methyladenine glycosylase family protein [Neobacillus sp. Marseille-QA0830]
MWQETIQIAGPYNFDSVLERHAPDPLKQLDLTERSIKVPIVASGSSAVVNVKATGTTEQPAFVLTGKIDDSKGAVIKRVAEIFQWDVPLKQIQQHFQQTDLRDIFNRFVGTPLVLDFDLFGSLVKCIIHQQINMTFAYKLTDRFVKKFGYEQEGVCFFPQPDMVAGLKVEQLRELQFSGRKAEYIISIAREMTENGLDLNELKKLQDDQIFNRLTQIRGVGKWTVENFLLFGLGRPNLFPLADIGIQNGLKRLYQMETKPTIEQMEFYKKNWEPYLSYASLYLWRSIE